ncbi:hypothetical protein BD769DRAFT_1661377 [Suillus cothurnatus]|nr:hypothetical protein BD769DRAFT_1661377 [Suillus cothurnatus]
MSHISDALTSDASDNESVVSVDTSPWNSVVNILGDVVFLDIQNVVSLDGTYCFNLNIDTPGTKRIVFRICKRVDMEEDVEHDESMNDQTLPEPIIASPCTLLTRRTGNPNPDPADPTAPWSYYVAKRAVEVLDETLDETLDEMLGDTQEDAED